MKKDHKTTFLLNVENMQTVCTYCSWLFGELDYLITAGLFETNGQHVWPGDDARVVTDGHVVNGDHVVIDDDDESEILELQSQLNLWIVNTVHIRAQHYDY